MNRHDKEGYTRQKTQLCEGSEVDDGTREGLNVAKWLEVGYKEWQGHTT